MLCIFSKGMNRSAFVIMMACIFTVILLCIGFAGYAEAAPVNVSQGKPTTASGTSGTSSNAVDGNAATRWSEQNYPQWIQVDLGQTYSVSKFELAPYQDRAYQYKIEVSTNGSSYTQVVDRTGNTTGGSLITDQISASNARYVRVTITGAYNYTGGWAALNEFGVMGEPSGTAPVNVSQGKPTTASGTSGTSGNAVDGDAATRWSEQNYPQWIQVDLGQTYSISKFEMAPYQDRAYQYKIEVSTNGTSYTQVVNRTGNTTGGSLITDQISASNARYVRVTITGAYNYTGGWAALNEFRVFGTGGTETITPKQKVLNYLNAISGTGIVSGQHNDRKTVDDPDLQTEQIHTITGAYPGLWSGDFSYDSRMTGRWGMIYEAEEQWNSGSLVNIMWHACPPTQSEPCNWDGGVKSSLTNAQWTELITNGTTLNNVWKSRMDQIAVYLQYLEDKGVAVLWRPLHEMNQGNFWWGGRPGANGTSKLYQITYDYLTNTKGLSNLIWVWDAQDLSQDIADYNPGSQYWDVFAFDIYDNGYNQSWYDYLLPIVGNKPMAIGECAKLPSSTVLNSQLRWVFFMGWADLVFSDNTMQQINNAYNHTRVINQNEMPGWN
ncbi:discoidin domain-containing protein [Paenibacillus ferrarius]|uniref:galactose-binding domain-containing protein n=1 Tax=Paenibacillus ferrarius TaxID=1469647 RepID=UPI003D286477